MSDTSIHKRAEHPFGRTSEWGPFTRPKVRKQTHKRTRRANRKLSRVELAERQTEEK